MGTCKHGNTVNVVKETIVLATKSGPEISNKDLSTLQEADLSAVEPGLVTEALEVMSEQIDKQTSATPGRLNE